jgi:hypothetical protein
MGLRTAGRGDARWMRLPLRSLIALACTTNYGMLAWPLRPTLAKRGGRMTRVISVRDSAQMRPVRSNGNTRVLTGPAMGTLEGTLRFTVNVRGAGFTFTFTLRIRGGGSVSGHGRGSLHIGHGPYASFAGTGAATHGTGRYRHASGFGHFYGAENRFTHDGTVQIFADLHY